jgi:hypothetical protein
VKLTPERKQLFISELARHGVLVRAARAASPHSTEHAGALQTFRDERGRDDQFAADWDAAMEHARGEVEHELFRRAQEGWEEPIYGGRYKETVVGTVRRYSDRLLELRAKALLPAYRDKPAVASSAAPFELGYVNRAMGEAIGWAILDQARAMALQGLVLLPSPVSVDVQS